MLTPKLFKQSWIITANYLIVALVSAAAFYLSVSFAFYLSGGWKWFWIANSIVFGLCAIFSGGLIVRPLHLTLNSEGFKLSGGWLRSPRFVAWQDIDGPFCCYSIGRGQALIGYNFVEGMSKKNRSPEHNDFSPDASFPSVWRESGEQMVDELNAYREQVLKETG